MWENNTTMVFYYFTMEIPVLCLGIILWIFCCHLAKKRREAEDWSARAENSPSVYIIPIYGEEEEEETEEEVMDIYEDYFQSMNQESSIYCSRDTTPPPPYTFEPPYYSDPPPSYSDPPTYPADD